MCIPELILLPRHHDHSDTALPRIGVFPHEERPPRRSTQIVRDERRASTPVNIVRISPRPHQSRARRMASEERPPSPEKQWRSGFEAGQQASQKERERLAISAKQAAHAGAALKAAGEDAKNANPSPPPPPPASAAAPAPPSLPQAPVLTPQPTPPEPPPVAAPSPPRVKAETVVQTGPERVIYHRRRRRSPSEESVSSASYRAVKRRISVIWGRLSGLERWRDERERERERAWEKERERERCERSRARSGSRGRGGRGSERMVRSSDQSVRWEMERRREAVRRSEARREEAEKMLQLERRARRIAHRWNWERGL